MVQGFELLGSCKWKTTQPPHLRTSGLQTAELPTNDREAIDLSLDRLKEGGSTFEVRGGSRRVQAGPSRQDFAAVGGTCNMSSKGHSRF